MECATLMVHCLLFLPNAELALRWPSGALEARALPQGRWRLTFNGGRRQLVEAKTVGELLKQLLLLWPRQTAVAADWARILPQLDKPTHTLRSFLSALKRHHVLELCDTEVPNSCLE